MDRTVDARAFDPSKTLSLQVCIAIERILCNLRLRITALAALAHCRATKPFAASFANVTSAA